MTTNVAAGKRRDKKKAKPLNPSLGVQMLLLLDVYFRLMLWATALTITLMVMARGRTLSALSLESLSTFKGAWDFTQSLTVFIMLFNLTYLLGLIAIRLIIPRPKRGIYKFRGTPNINLFF